MRRTIPVISTTVALVAGLWLGGDWFQATPSARQAPGGPTTQAARQGEQSQPLDGTELEYTYADGGSVVVTFYDGLLKFRWIAGPAAGATGEGYPYRAHVVAEGIYLVNWHMTDQDNFITLLVDLPRNAVYGSALMAYGTDQEQVIFDGATIDRVRR